MLSVEVSVIAWKGAAVRSDMSELRESMATPSDHWEKTVIDSDDPTVGGVKIVLTLKEKVEETALVKPVT